MRGIAITAFISVMVTSSPVPAQSGQSLQSRLDRLEREIQTLSRAVYRGEKPPQTAQQPAGTSGQSDFRANIQVQISDLEQRLSALTGKYQRNRNRIDKLAQRLETALSDIRMRLEKLEGAQQQQKPGQASQTSERQQAGSTTDQAEEQPVSVPELAQSVAQGEQGGQSTDEATLGTITTKPDSQSDTDNASQASGNNTGSSSDQATEAYEQAFAKLKDGKYEAAATAFQSFMDKYPDHKLVLNAHYWLGESYYARDRYQKAARTFAEGYQEYPEGKKAADNLLKLGLSLEAMDRKKDACVALNQLKQKFGDASGPVIRRADKEIERIGCE